jgi:hypothetical protein
MDNDSNCWIRCVLSSFLRMGDVFASLTSARIVGHYDEIVRRNSTNTFRKLVPLAPAAALYSSSSQSNITQLSISGSMSRSMKRIDQSGAEIDVFICQCLSSLTNLLRPHDKATKTASSLKSLSQSSLRSYQIEGMTWLTQLRRYGLSGCLADEMGLGKSLQVLTSLAITRFENCFSSASFSAARDENILEDQLISLLHEAARISCPFLVVCPASLCHHWVNEIEKYFPPSVLAPMRSNRNQSKQQSFLELLSGNNLIITTYDSSLVLRTLSFFRRRRCDNTITTQNNYPLF